MNQTRNRVLAVVIGLLIATTAQSARAENATLEVVNDTSSYVTVSVDGNYGCNTADHTTCTIAVTVGHHQLHAARSDNGATADTEADIDSGGLRWTLSE